VLDEALHLNAELVRSRRRVVEAGDHARRRIERDLHDGAQQRLVALAMRMRALESQAADGTRPSPEWATGLSGLIGEVDRTLDELRNLAHGVYPPVLSTHGLGAAFADVARASSGRVVVRDLDPAGDRPHRAAEEALYFTGLEAIANATKHAPESIVEVTVSASTDEAVVIVRDTGSGFDPAEVGDSTGLSNMRDRVESLGGRLAIESAPGSGTTVTARVHQR
jgi:signal transduction histidine kinase